ncbi:hypothetical protein KPH14_005417 [Odynerus spinipes]|uniref:Disks large homolog 5 N-terminal domain-containing protein n=1 Tax=Odynerus spinipes TaxID=1348599 RepID=A0AAD9RCE7_9HYME|nr:hypothetical protein KPH14_005417 [Odynerus spinipes]
MQDNQDKENAMSAMNCNGVKLQEILKIHEKIEMQIYDINYLKIKASAKLEELKARNEMLQVQLKDIHDNYMSYVTKVNSEYNEKEEIRAKIQKLTIERDELRERLEGYKRSNDENNEKINKFITMIEIEKKRNAALLRKLERASKVKNIPQSLRDKINAILNDRSLHQA